VIDSTRHFLSRLSREEEAFEQDLLRVIFAHAPTDEKTENESEPISGGTVCEEKLREQTEELFRNLKEDAIFFCVKHLCSPVFSGGIAFVPVRKYIIKEYGV